jgi:hypothetical protein
MPEERLLFDTHRQACGISMLKLGEALPCHSMRVAAR